MERAATPPTTPPRPPSTRRPRPAQPSSVATDIEDLYHRRPTAPALDATFLRRLQTAAPSLRTPQLCRLLAVVSQNGGARPTRSWLDAFFDAVAPRLPDFTAQDAAMLSAGSAALGASPGSAFQAAFLLRTSTHLDSPLLGVELAHLLHGLSVWGARPDTSWLRRYWAQVEMRAEEGSLTSRELASVLRCAARGRFDPPPETLLALVDAAETWLPLCSAADLSQCLWALVKLRAVLGDDFLGAACAEARRQHAWAADELSMFLWCLAQLRHRPSDAWLMFVADAATPSLPSASPLALANTAWSFAVLDWAPPVGSPFRAALSDGVLHCLRGSGMPPHEAARLAWAAVALQMYELPCLGPLWTRLAALEPAAAGSWDAAMLRECALVAELEAPGLLAPLPDRLAAAAAAAWAEQSARDARARRGRTLSLVVSSLKTRLKLGSHSLVCPRSGRQIDAALAPVGTLRFALMVDGPASFSANTWERVGATRLRDRHLALTGWRVLSVPFFSSEQYSTLESLATFLARRLSEAAAAHLASEAAANEECPVS